VTVFAKTDLGQSRDHNEDTFLVADLTTGKASLMPDVRSHDVGERGSLFMVADGMGGAAAGELASSMAVDLIYRHLSTTWPHDEEISGARFAYRVREAVELANGELYAYALEHPDVRGMGTTVTLVGVFGAELILAQIGDSRAYLVRGGQAIQLTRDQSLTQRLVDAGELTEEEAERSERRNIILQALGPDPRVRVDLSQQSLRRDDILIMCSDGLSGSVRKDEIAALAGEHSELSDLCSALIDLANERGGPDNITVVAARFSGDVLPESDGTSAVGYQNITLDGTEPDTDEHEVVAVPPEEPRPSFALSMPRLVLIGLTLLAAVLAALLLS